MNLKDIIKVHLPVTKIDKYMHCTYAYVIILYIDSDTIVLVFFVSKLMNIHNIDICECVFFFIFFCIR